MKVILSKEAKKSLKKMDRNTLKKINKAIDGIAFHRHTMKLINTPNGGIFRVKLEHYRIIFSKVGSEDIFIEDIITKNDATWGKTKCCH